MDVLLAGGGAVEGFDFMRYMKYMLISQFISVTSTKPLYQGFMQPLPSGAQ